MKAQASDLPASAIDELELEEQEMNPDADAEQYTSAQQSNLLERLILDYSGSQQMATEYPGGSDHRAADIDSDLNGTFSSLSLPTTSAAPAEEIADAPMENSAASVAAYSMLLLSQQQGQ